jgi:RNA-directed DNA polymerase
MEKRDRPGETTRKAAEGQIQGWQSSQPHLQRVNAAARRSGQIRFTALLHHVNVAALERAFKRLRRAASAGVDGVTVEMYAQDLQSNLQRLCDRVHSGRYWPKPVRRTFIPKADGGQRPLGIPALEDKIVQSAVAEVLSAVYEVDFVDFSYGFRPGRSAHMALARLDWCLQAEKVNWILDVDIRKFYDSVDHGWLLRMIAHRIADRRVLRLIERWLKAGVLESGCWQATEVGTPQGSGISPLLANAFLHYVFDLWSRQWIRRTAAGQVVTIRYADDLVLGFQYESDARRMFSALTERLAKFGLSLNEGKTRLIEFGRFAARDRKAKRLQRPETFNFLGFTHYCSETRGGKFTVKRRTNSQRMARKLSEVRLELKRRMHLAVKAQHLWLAAVLRGHYQYFGVMFNASSLTAFYKCVRLAWFNTLRRRSQKGRMSWERYVALLAVFPLPKPRIVHQPWRGATA